MLKYILLKVGVLNFQWCKNKWVEDIPNKELVKTAYELYKDKSNINFIHIKAHTNNLDIHSIGNDNADKLATIAIIDDSYSSQVLVDIGVLKMKS